MTATLSRARRNLLVALLALGTNVICCATARGDGGQLQTTGQVGPWIVSVFTAPTPLCVGPVDVSVLVQHAQTGESVDGATIRLIAREANSDFKLERLATHDAATNKLFQSAWFDVPTPGRWVVTTEIAYQGETAATTCDLWVSTAPWPWSDMVFWIAWPALPIGLYAGAQVRAARRNRASN